MPLLNSRDIITATAGSSLMYSPWLTNSLITFDYKSGSWDGVNSRQADAHTWNKTDTMCAQRNVVAISRNIYTSSTVVTV